MFAVWLPPKATVPASFDDEEPFVLSARELRGVLSQGMLAAADELAIGADHEGIIEINPDEWKPSDVPIAPGVSFAKAYGLDDTIIDIENKMFTHRPDLFGQLGVAREIAGILGTTFTSPEWYRENPRIEQGEGLTLTVKNEAPEKVPRFMAIALKDVEVKPSPLWLQCALVALGSKSINNIVDVTNYVMLLTAQPVHAYDYDKLRGNTLVARYGKEGEKIKLLNDKTYTVDEADIVIADAEGAVGLAGIMGGGDSEISAETKNIVLEVATFDMYAVRKTSMKHGVFTDALARFNKGQSPLQNSRVLELLVQSIIDVSGGARASALFDEWGDKTTTDAEMVHAPVTVSVAFINERLGLELKSADIQTLLRNVEMKVDETETDILSVRAPFWRTDIELAEDVVEEVGRLYGYDALPRALPLRSSKPAEKNAYRELAAKIRAALARAGANEVLTYSFVHESVLKGARQDVSDAYKLSNALSPDIQYYRQSLTPSLLDKMHANLRAGYNEFALFEIGKSHSKKAGYDTEGLPVEPGRIALAYAAKQAGDGAAYFRVKHMLEYVLGTLGFVVETRALPEKNSLTAAAPFMPSRSARIIDTVSGQALGVIGEYAPSVRKAFKLPEYSAGFELFTEGLLLADRTKRSTYRPLSKFPVVERDVCFETDTTTSYADILAAITTNLAAVEIPSTVEPVDIYRQSDTAKRTTVRVRLMPEAATLTSEDANAIIETMTHEVARVLNATII
jgi:phenylalanyl-tRNA synthetase beta chain